MFGEILPTANRHTHSAEPHRHSPVSSLPLPQTGAARPFLGTEFAIHPDGIDRSPNIDAAKYPTSSTR